MEARLYVGSTSKVTQGYKEVKNPFTHAVVSKFCMIIGTLRETAFIALNKSYLFDFKFWDLPYREFPPRIFPEDYLIFRVFSIQGVIKKRNISSSEE